MDFLSIFVAGVGVLIHYRQIKKSYDSVQSAIEAEADVIFYLESNERVVGIDLIREVVIYQNQKFSDKEENYQQKMNDLRDYMAQAVHDLKVNLAVCEMITKRMGIDSDVGFDMLNKLTFQNEQMKFRMNQILYVARANHYSEDILSEKVDLHKTLREAIRDNAEFFMNKNVSLSVSVEPYSVTSDQKWVHYILTQILNNSSKYVGHDGIVEIIGIEDDKTYRLKIRDNGMGINQDEMQRVFDKGFTGSNGRQNTKSTGMGMYYAKKMAMALEIGLKVTSQKDYYTEFELIFYKLPEYFKVTEMSL
ncbi:MAG: sensor histidine kinase [Cellulosilyticaceae bacterium]